MKAAPLEALFDAVEAIRTQRKDNTYNTMPVVDGALIPDSVDRLIKTPLPVDYLISYTNADMYAPMLAWIGNRYARRNSAYVCFFDLDAPGDDNRAFHSSDVRYVFGTLDRSWRPYGERDHQASDEMTAYLSDFARSGDPNGDGLPVWKKAGHGPRTRVLRIGKNGTHMSHVRYGRLLRNFLRRSDPTG